MAQGKERQKEEGRIKGRRRGDVRHATASPSAGGFDVGCLRFEVRRVEG
jgi:hypothetical protein